MRIYLVGGAVREDVMERPASKDFDFAVEGTTYNSLVEWLKAQGATIWLEYPEYFTLRCKINMARVGLGSAFGGMIPEGEIAADFALCREEAGYTDHRRPDKVFPATIYSDLSRRDFTVNAMALTMEGELIDPHGGKLDCENHVLRTVGEPLVRFREDSLRILRAFRFAVTHEMWFAPNLSSVLSDGQAMTMLRTLPVERVQAELMRALKHDWVSTMRLLTVHYPGSAGVLQRMFPSLWLKPTTEDR